ncbi:UvrD-helicase domain-containing protein [Cryptosporangium aurantiacum]|uniref:DNA 3'-5' helicase n=1 Tax=Cryptosporangium aurantiacum TaxID=134849 RepID=A0A1M7MUP1_9ACTN|nr:UvrD-helicase domain-containing protein [Cryptosporangium aurantiacum]SHM94759.1 UvrD/REP helicase N-terminal domain-containing protein [Cryptosporangium aurantiacum]
MAQLAVHVEFLGEFGRLDPAQRDDVRAALARFPELPVEPVPGGRDDRLGTVRLTEELRATVAAPDDVRLLLGVRPEAEAVTWAKHHALAVNAASGVLDVTDVEELERLLPDYRKAAEEAPALLFDRLTDQQLHRLGISADVLAVARTVRTLDQLRTLEHALPEAQYTTLHLLGDGLLLSPDGDQPSYADDLAAAIRRSQGRIALVDGPVELLALLAIAPSRLRVFLHPEQETVAYRPSYAGPAIVFGGPGTGKSVTALHRVRHLVTRAEIPPSSVLLTSFSDELAAALERDLEQILDAGQRTTVRVVNLDRLADEVVAERHGALRYVTDDEYARLWADASRRTGGRYGPHFLRREWEGVVFAQRIADLDGYLAADRRGRGLRLATAQRQQLWPGLAEASRVLLATGVWTPLTVADQAAQLLAERPEPLFRHVVVDEVQDLHPAQWRLLRAAAAAGPDDLFLTGDPHQRIHGYRVHLKTLGIDVEGRSTRLTVNYRTTAQILGWAMRVLAESDSDDLDGGVDSMRGYRSAGRGADPELVGYPNAAAELAGLAEAVRRWHSDGVDWREIGVAARTPRVARGAAAALADARVPVGEDGITVGTMHGMKGLEFRRAALIGVNDGAVPDPSALTPEDDDPLGYALDLQEERSVLFVAATRGRELLRVSWWGSPSSLIPR